MKLFLLFRFNKTVWKLLVNMTEPSGSDSVETFCHGSEPFFCKTATKKHPVSWWWGRILILKNKFIFSDPFQRQIFSSILYMSTLFSQVLPFKKNKRGGFKIKSIFHLRVFNVNTGENIAWWWWEEPWSIFTFNPLSAMSHDRGFSDRINIYFKIPINRWKSYWFQVQKELKRHWKKKRVDKWQKKIHNLLI